MLFDILQKADRIAALGVSCNLISFRIGCKAIGFSFAENQPIYLRTSGLRAGAGDSGTKENRGKSVFRIDVYGSLAVTSLDEGIFSTRPSALSTHQIVRCQSSLYGHEDLQGHNTEVALYGSFHLHASWSQSSPSSLATRIYVHFGAGIACMALSLILIPFTNIYPQILPCDCRIFFYSTPYQVKHETSVNKPSWLPLTGRLTLKVCRSKTLESWLLWLVCPPEARA